MKNWYGLPEEHHIDLTKQIPSVLQRMREFIDCYEQAFASKTEWEPVFRFVEEPDEADDTPSGVDMTADDRDEPLVAEPLDWGDRELLQRPKEKEPSGRHREPYILFI